MSILGIEFGSTRIKAVAIEGSKVIASGSHDWENKHEHGYWTYDLTDAQTGARQTLAGMDLQGLEAMGVSGMMHGYLAFDREGKLLTPFRTWRNTSTEQAAKELSALFGFNIPQRWSVAHLYQAILNHEDHVKDIAFLTTLSGYVHWKLTGQKVLGAGEASGMFPLRGGDYDPVMMEKFQQLTGIDWTTIAPKVLMAGDAAGALTPEGADWLGLPRGLAGLPLCPPEGDAGTGMVATNAVAPGTGNVSAGTSIFVMAVLERPLSRAYTEVGMVTTPAGAPVAMAHGATCTSDLDAWVRLFGELSPLGKPALYDFLYNKALEAAPDAGGLVNFNCYAGEPVIGLSKGCPLFTRAAGADLTLANFMRAQLFSSLAVLRMGMDLLFGNENVALDHLTGHGGLFKTKGVGQRIMAGALGVPVAVMATAGEGGPWGMALLAAYMLRKTDSQSLEAFLAEVFSSSEVSVVSPEAEIASGFAAYLERYKACLPAERAAAEAL